MLAAKCFLFGTEKLWWPVENKMSFRNVHQVEDVWRMRLASGTLTATKEGWLSCSFFSWSPGLIIIIIVILIIIINQCHSHIPCLANILILLLFMFCKSTINITITFHSIKGTRQFQSSIPSFCPKKGNFNTTNTKRQFQSCKSGKCTECTFNSDCPGSRVIQEYWQLSCFVVFDDGIVET